MLPIVLLTLIQAAACQSSREYRGLGHYRPPDATRTPANSSSRLEARDIYLRDGVYAESYAPAQVITSAGPEGTVQILASKQAPPGTGSAPTELETSGHDSAQPLLTSPIPNPTSLLSADAAPPGPSSSSAPEPVSLEGDSADSEDSADSTNMVSSNIFSSPIATTAPPAVISKRTDHPVPRLGIIGAPPIPTNKFYANFFLGSQSAPTYLHPYAVAWAKGAGASASWGLSVSHIEAGQRVYGPTAPQTGAASYFINPVGIQSLVISAKELGASTALTSDLLTAFSARISLRASASGPPVVQFPLVQGSGFVTALYSGGTPMIQSGVFFKTVTRSTKAPRIGVTKYKFSLEDGTMWLLYAWNTRGDALDLQVVNNGLAQSRNAFYGVIQVAKDPGGGEAVYDKACGGYATGVVLSGTTSGATGTYTLAFSKAGMPGTALAMWALPHHVGSFDDGTRGQLVAALKLQTTTKGVATAVVADTWTMVEPDLPTGMGFLPWSAQAGGIGTLSATTKAFIHNIAQQEMSQNVQQQTNQNSMYFSGKALAKFATIVMVINDMLGDQALAQTGLNQLKVAFSLFAANKQQYPLVYESAWGGVVSSASYATGNSGADFGNTYYNDHHFHYGYFIYCAAVIAHLDPSWLGANRAYVDTLVRDVANPSAHDKFFPQFRCFDWFHGHSWAHGLFETLDGKDQESSSEDTMHAYAIKMWGQATGDGNMAARGNLMLAVQARSLQAYYLYTADNTVQPSGFVGNRVAGILFENKVDHTTYFGTNIEYIQGIHMLPLLPHTPYVRLPAFVSEEWQALFGGGRAAAVPGGWHGILLGNYATIDPRGAYASFSASNFDPGWLDGGASLTWYLAYSAALGGL